MYVRLLCSQIPVEWSNEQDDLEVDENFTRLNKWKLKYGFGMPNPRPILIINWRGESEYIIDGGDGKYYSWDKWNDRVCLINQPDLEQILACPDLYLRDSTYLGDVL